MANSTRRTILGLGIAAVTITMGAVTYTASAAEQTRPPRPVAGRPTPGRPAPSRPAPGRPTPTPVASAPANLTPDPALGERPLFSARVVDGVQTYTCSGGQYGGASVPEADLVGARGLEIHHFKGPSWQSEEDDSLVTAKAIANSPVTGSIPQLLLEVTSHSGPADGIMAKVKHIQRLNTSGGTPDLTDECTDGDTDDRDYRATYVFWG
ncbi:DUF3455 domain-containing protein [Actinoplanes sp. NPDC049265]|uniref:DUF3455 domain-containing protein n=1 Tax=Actinoplanes sp. NPDC049265 TaxID=3363902 RepID=UPI0037232B38